MGFYSANPREYTDLSNQVKETQVSEPVIVEIGCGKKGQFLGKVSTR
jgi:hypothetical protein